MTGARPTVAFLTHVRIGEWQRGRWGFDVLAAQGFRVLVLDVSPFIERGGAEIFEPYAVGPAEVRCVPTLARYREEVAALSGSAVVIDQIVSISSEYDAVTLPLFRVLHGYGVPYYALVAGDVPRVVHGHTGTHEAVFLRARLRKLADPRAVGNLLARLWIRIGALTGQAVPRPDLVFGNLRSPTVSRYLERYRFPSGRVVPAHSYDHDRYLEFRRGHGADAFEPDGTCVFLDQAVMTHPDMPKLGLGLSEPETYLRALNRLFDTVERETGLRVVVAAHPLADYAEREGCFGDREVVFGKTLELVARCSCAINHASTAVNWAVLLDKPLLLCATRDMVRTTLILDIEAMASALGLRVLDLDDERAVAGLDWDFSAWSRDAYRDYCDTYVRSPDAPQDRLTYEILGERASFDLAALMGVARDGKGVAGT